MPPVWDLKRPLSEAQSKTPFWVAAKREMKKTASTKKEIFSNDQFGCWVSPLQMREREGEREGGKNERVRGTRARCERDVSQTRATRERERERENRETSDGERYKRGIFISHIFPTEFFSTKKPLISNTSFKFWHSNPLPLFSFDAQNNILLSLERGSSYTPF